MEKPDVFALSRLPWQFFVTLTFVREKIPDGLRRKYWFVYVRTIAGNFGLHFTHVLWLLRTEYGEQNGRFHYHALVGGLPPHVLTEKTCFALNAQWELQKPLVLRKSQYGDWRMLSKFCGSARVRIYNPGMDGLDYFVPESGMDGGTLAYSLQGANTYEVKKFGGADKVEYSLSCARLVSASRRRLGKPNTVEQALSCERARGVIA